VQVGQLSQRAPYMADSDHKVCCRGIQQEKMARYCREIFGDLLLDEPLPNFPVSQKLSSVTFSFES